LIFDCFTSSFGVVYGARDSALEQVGMLFLDHLCQRLIADPKKLGRERNLTSYFYKRLANQIMLKL
jgi:hypothetical protein